MLQQRGRRWFGWLTFWTPPALFLRALDHPFGATFLLTLGLAPLLPGGWVGLLAWTVAFLRTGSPLWGPAVALAGGGLGALLGTAGRRWGTRLGETLRLRILGGRASKVGEAASSPQEARPQQGRERALPRLRLRLPRPSRPSLALPPVRIGQASAEPGGEDPVLAAFGALWTLWPAEVREALRPLRAESDGRRGRVVLELTRRRPLEAVLAALAGVRYWFEGGRFFVLEVRAGEEGPVDRWVQVGRDRRGRRVYLHPLAGGLLVPTGPRLPRLVLGQILAAYPPDGLEVWLDREAAEAFFGGWRTPHLRRPSQPLAAALEAARRRRTGEGARPLLVVLTLDGEDRARQAASLLEARAAGVVPLGIARGSGTAAARRYAWGWQLGRWRPDGEGWWLLAPAALGEVALEPAELAPESLAFLHGGAGEGDPLRAWMEELYRPGG